MAVLGDGGVGGLWGWFGDLYILKQLSLDIFLYR